MCEVKEFLIFAQCEKYIEPITSLEHGGYTDMVDLDVLLESYTKEDKTEIENFQRLVPTVGHRLRMIRMAPKFREIQKNTNEVCRHLMCKNVKPEIIRSVSRFSRIQRLQKYVEEFDEEARIEFGENFDALKEALFESTAAKSDQENSELRKFLEENNLGQTYPLFERIGIECLEDFRVFVLEKGWAKDFEATISASGSRLKMNRLASLLAEPQRPTPPPAPATTGYSTSKKPTEGNTIPTEHRYAEYQLMPNEGARQHLQGKSVNICALTGDHDISTCPFLHFESVPLEIENVRVNNVSTFLFEPTTGLQRLTKKEFQSGILCWDFTSTSVCHNREECKFLHARQVQAKDANGELKLFDLRSLELSAGLKRYLYGGFNKHGGMYRLAQCKFNERCKDKSLCDFLHCKSPDATNTRKGGENMGRSPTRKLYLLVKGRHYFDEMFRDNDARRRQQLQRDFKLPGDEPAVCHCESDPLCDMLHFVTINVSGPDGVQRELSAEYFRPTVGMSKYLDGEFPAGILCHNDKPEQGMKCPMEDNCKFFHYHYPTPESLPLPQLAMRAAAPAYSSTTAAQMPPTVAPSPIRKEDLSQTGPALSATPFGTAFNVMGSTSTNSQGQWNRLE